MLYVSLGKKQSVLINEIIYVIIYFFPFSQQSLQEMSFSEADQSVYLYIYYSAYFCFGLILGTLGAMIPFLAERHGVDETQYSFMFAVRMVGSFLSFLLLKHLLKHYQNIQHLVIMTALLLGSFAMIIFPSWNSFIGVGFCISLFGIGQYCTFVGSNLCIFHISDQKNSGSRLIICNAIFSTGALISPQLLRFMEFNAYYLFTVLFLGVSVLCWRYETPVNNLNSNTKASHDKKHFKQASTKLQILIACGLFVIGGSQMMVNGWMSTYAVEGAHFTKQEATICVTIFWLTSTICRFIAVSLNVKDSIKLKILLYGLVVSSLISIMLHHMEEFTAVAYLAPFFFGVSCSSVFPLILSISTQYGLKFRPEQLSNIMIMPIISAGISGSLTGLFMKKNTANLFYILLVTTTSLLILSKIFFRVMEQEKAERESKKDLQLQLIEASEKMTKTDVFV